MLKLFLMTALANFPFGMFIGGVSFLLSKGLLTFRHPAIATITKLAMLLISLAAIMGVLYGLLRFNGVIIFATDNTISYNWFDASWRDDGFGIIYFFGCVLLGMALAVQAKWKVRRSEA